MPWNAFADERHRQIASGKDLSFRFVLVPAVLQLLKGVDLTRLLDVGAGTGDLTAHLAELGSEILLGIDPSTRSLDVAQQVLASKPRVSLRQGSLEELANDLRSVRFTAAVAAMTLMTVPNIDSFAKSLAMLFENRGTFVATMTHPWFWPTYWGYDSETWFTYDKELFIEAPFRITAEKSSILTTHVHRPLESYVRTFNKVGFKLDALLEPRPSEEVERLYPLPWRYPRFLGMRWEKT